MVGVGVFYVHVQVCVFMYSRTICMYICSIPVLNLVPRAKPIYKTT